MTWGALAEAATRVTAPATVALEAPTVPSATFALDLGATGSLLQLLTKAQLGTISRRLGMTLPAMRSGHAVITKRPARWPLRVWKGEQLALYQPAWLSNPDPRITFYELVSATLDDAVWEDRAYWGVTKRGADGYPLSFERIPVERVTEMDGELLIDGKKPSEAMPYLAGPVVFGDGRILESVIPFRWNGLGGMAKSGSVIVDLSLSMLSAATNYANSPLPSTILTPEPGAARLDDDEVEALLAKYEEKRAARATAYLNGVSANFTGFSARDLQLVEGREHNALEIARALSLPAPAVQASNGASLEYSTTVENRRDVVQANQMWNAPLEQGLSLHALPRGIDVRFDVTADVRDDALTRMQIWTAGLASGALTLDDVKRQEPLAGGAA